MHQHPRPPPVTASPASSPRTNPTRTNNPREESSHTRSPSDMGSYNDTDEGSGDSGVMAGPSKDSVKKLDQIIQNFHTKSAMVILQSRMSLPVVISRDGSKKVNKWFSIETDDTNAFREDLSVYKTCGGFQRRPPPLIIEVYLDLSGLTNSQSLVIVDDQGKRWDVVEALSNSTGSNDHSHPRKRIQEVTLERWKVELLDGTLDPSHDFAAFLPTVYKKCIVFFRSLYTTAKFVPAWKFVKTLAKSGAMNSAIKVKCRITSKPSSLNGFDTLTHPLYDSGQPRISTYSLGTTDTPVGKFSAEVTYRPDCTFRIDDSESILSSRFMGVDEHYFQPSLGGVKGSMRQPQRPIEVGSLPSHRQRMEAEEPIQAYGSLSTFHGEGAPLASSPISALRAARTPGSDTSSPPIGSSPRSRPIYASRGSLKSLEGVGRRPSVSFQPFKAGSLSSSPGRATPLSQVEGMPPQSPQSLPRTSGISALAQARNRSSLTAGMPASLRGGPPISDHVVTSSASSSPKPAPISRYSSSFTHRRGRSSFGAGTSRVLDDDQNSSGKQSMSSSVQPGSGVLAETGAGGSSGSLQTDDDNISDFLKLLDSKKSLPSFQANNESTTRHTNTNLSRFLSMREPNNALTDSMSSSLLLHRSSSSSSRQLSSVPPMMAANSASSSPGKPISPHTPHTPAVPSRLSANSIAEYSEPRVRRSRVASESRLEGVEDDDAPNDFGTNAIDIPTSPRTYYPHTRRSSSVAQQHRALAMDDDLGELPFGVHRSISLGADVGEPPSLNSLRGIGQSSGVATTVASDSPAHLLQPAPAITETDAMSRQPSSSLDQQETEAQPPARTSAGSMNSPYRARLVRGSGRGLTPPTGSYSSLSERGGGSVNSERGGRNSFTRTTGTFDADEEPLVFDMSEMGDNSRRSIEDNRSGHTPAERGIYDPSRGGDSGSNSRRGSRRAWP